MSLHQDLLDQAGHLVKREPKRPKQASLRRAVSAAYYAVFHMLIDAASRFVVRGSNRPELRRAVTRAFDHGEMKSAANSFKGGTLPSVLQGAVPGPIPLELRRLCVTFIDLQQTRHEADYDLTRVFGRREAQDLVTKAEQAFQDWSKVAGTHAADAFLVALLLRKKLER
ncbi:MAG: hypothetical protein ABIO70_34900 [Pseudomonadota bacterium]